MTDFVRMSYVRAIHGLGNALRPIGALKILESRSGLTARWLRSLFAIYDIDDLVHLDAAWWTFQATDHVDAFLKSRPNARVFEWGSGASTIWLAKRAAQVVSIEHDHEWAKQVRSRVCDLDHVELNVVAPTESGLISSAKRGFEGQYFDDYVAKIDDADGMFDLIVIDGRARNACLDRAVSRLSEGGMILLDDFKRTRYQTAAQSRGMHILNLDGLAACLPLPDSTAILTNS